MANNIELKSMSANSGAYERGTVMATVQNVDGSHSQRVVVDNPVPYPAQIETTNDGYKSLPNSTPDAGVTLAAGATWSGGADSPLNYGGVRLIVHSTQPSAANGLKVYCSSDGVSWHLDNEYTIPAGIARTFEVTVAPYIMVTYTNGATPATLRLCTLYLKHMSVVSSHRVQDNLRDDDDGQLMVSVLKLRTAQDDYVSGAATSGGNFKVSLEEVNGVVVPTTRADDFLGDAFQRLRTSSPDTRFDINFKYDKQPLVFDEILSGAGTATHSATARDVVLAVGSAATGSRAALCQHWYNVYTPGNSQYVILTGTLNASNLSGATVEYFLRSSVTGSVVETAQAITPAANWSRSQIFIIDFQSLDVGRIRYALDAGGLIAPLGAIVNDNIRATAYWQTPSLPVCYDVYNTATESVTEFRYGDAANAVGFRLRVARNAGHTSRAICATVKSEGGGGLLDLDGYPFSAGNEAATRTVAATLIPLMSVQLKTTYNGIANRGLVLPQSYSFISDGPIYYQVVVNPTLTGANYVSVSPHSISNVDIAATALSGGRVIASGYVGAGGQRAGGAERGITSKLPLSVNYMGTVGDIISIAAQRVGAVSASAGAVLEWREVR